MHTNKLWLFWDGILQKKRGREKHGDTRKEEDDDDDDDGEIDTLVHTHTLSLFQVDFILDFL